MFVFCLFVTAVILKPWLYQFQLLAAQKKGSSVPGILGPLLQKRPPKLWSEPGCPSKLATKFLGCSFLPRRESFSGTLRSLKVDLRS